MNYSKLRPLQNYFSYGGWGRGFGRGGRGHVRKSPWPPLPKLFSNRHPMDAALNQFYQHLGVERGLAPLTVAAYARDLLDFWEYLEGARPIPLGRRGPRRPTGLFRRPGSPGAVGPQPGPAPLRPAAIFPLPAAGGAGREQPRGVAGLAAPAPAAAPGAGGGRSGGAALPPRTPAPRRACGTRPSWRCSMPPASGSRSWWA